VIHRSRHHARVLKLGAAVCALIALVLASQASGHGTLPGPGFRSAISGIQPVLPGLLVRALDDGRLSVANWTNRVVVIDGPGGRPQYRFANRRVYRTTAAGWRMMKRGESHTWHDPRIHWAGPTPRRSGLVSRFEIPGRANGVPFAISGFIGYRLPPSDAGIPAWGVVALTALGLTIASALALALLTRRKGEDSTEPSAPTGSP